MQATVLSASLIAGALLISIPSQADASRFERGHGHYGKHYRHHHRYDRHHRRHFRRSHSYWGVSYPGYNVWYRDWPVGVHFDLHRHRHHRDKVVVVNAGTETSGLTQVARNTEPQSEMFIYPREGQSAEQRDQDRYECHLWSRDQTGFDPSDSNIDFDLAPDYARAMSACLEGRGYTVK